MTTAEKLLRAKTDYDEVYEAGKQALLREAWETWQDGGNRRRYQYACGDNALTWTEEMYAPIYPFICSQDVYAATSIFYSNKYITDTKVPIHIIGVRADTTFYKCSNLKRIVELHLENVVRFSNTFLQCYALEELIVTGTIDIDGFNVEDSKKLNRASIESIINALSTTTTGLTVTLSLDAVKKAFETAEGANDGNTSSTWTTLAATKPNWTISLV